MKKYIKKVREQLYCNATENYKNNYITYDYTNKQIDEYLDYFEKCKINNLSSYKALLFFGDYINEDFIF